MTDIKPKRRPIDKALPVCPACGGDEYQSANHNGQPAFKCRECNAMYKRNRNGACRLVQDRLAERERAIPKWVDEPEPAKKLPRAQTLAEAEAMEAARVKAEAEAKAAAAKPAIVLSAVVVPPKKRTWKPRPYTGRGVGRPKGSGNAKGKKIKLTCGTCKHVYKVNTRRTDCMLTPGKRVLCGQGACEQWEGQCDQGEVKQ